MTAALGAVGAGGVNSPQPTLPAAPAPSGAPTFAQALAAEFATSVGAPAPPSSFTANSSSVTLGQMLGRKVPAFVAPPSSPLAPAGTSGLPPASDSGMVRPAEGRISSEFGPRVHPVTGKHRPHNGIDVAGPVGAPIRAAAAGTVSFAGVRGGYGNLIIVDHGDGRETYYAHNSANDVSVGQQVSAGQHIGKVGATGQVTGPHLHFEVRVNGTPEQPRDHVSF